jgi:uncharacterized protein (DUF433 family)
MTSPRDEWPLDLRALLGRVTTKPGVLLGKPIIRGTRISVENLLEKLDAGSSVEQILADCPDLDREDVLGAVLHGYRTGSLTAGAAAMCFGIQRLELILGMGRAGIAVEWSEEEIEEEMRVVDEIPRDRTL